MDFCSASLDGLSRGTTRDAELDIVLNAKHLLVQRCASFTRPCLAPGRPEDCLMQYVHVLGALGGTLFTEDLSSSVVISSFSQFMAASNAHDSEHAPYRYGLQGSMTEVEPGYSLSFIIAAGPSGGADAGHFKRQHRACRGCDPPQCARGGRCYREHDAARGGRKVA